jgi:hypothetical protein
MSTKLIKSDNTGRIPLKINDNQCCACALINALCERTKNHYCTSHEHFEPIFDKLTHNINEELITIDPTNHMMTLKTIKFPNNIPKLLDFKLDFKSRKYTIGNGQDCFNINKSETFPLYCVTNSGSKFSLFGENFLALSIRTYLCAIANYCQAIKMNASFTVMMQRKSQIVKARYIMDKKPVDFKVIDHLLLDIKWTSSIYDLYNIDRTTLSQIINKKCCAYKFIPQIVSAVNARYIFDVDLILQASLMYFENINITLANNAKLAILQRSIINLSKKLNINKKDLCDEELNEHLTVLSEKKIIYDNIIKILIPKYANYVLNNNNSIKDILLNTLILCDTLDFYNREIFEIFRLLIINLSSHDSQDIIEFCTYFYKTFPQNAKIRKEEIMEHNEVHFDNTHNINAINDRRNIIHSLLQPNIGIVSELKIMKAIRSTFSHCKSDYSRLMKYISSDNITFEHLQSIYIDIVDRLQYHKHIKSASDKQNALDFSYDRVNDFIHSNVNSGINIITSIIINNVKITEKIIRWFYTNKCDDFVNLFTTYLTKIITEDYDDHRESLNIKICIYANDTKLIRKELNDDMGEDRICDLYDRIDENDAQIIIWNKQLEDSKIDIDTSTIDKILCLVKQYKLYNDKLFRQTLSKIYDQDNVFPIDILQVCPIPKIGRVLNKIYNESLYFTNESGYKFYSINTSTDYDDIQKLVHYQL